MDLPVRRSMLDLALVLALAWIGATVFARLAADAMIFQPPPSSYAGEMPGLYLVQTSDGVRVATLYLPNPVARYTLLYSHGNAEDLGHVAPVLALLRGAGFAVLAYDYRGYGASDRVRPTTQGALEDARAVYRHATQALGIDPSRLILHGRSVGAAPAIELAASEPVAGLIVESAFVSAYRVLTRVPLLPMDRFDNLSRIRSVRCPVLVIHGRRDDIVAFWHGERLLRAAPSARQSWWLDGAGHNDLVAVAGAEYPRRLRAFADTLGRPD
ncbi:alpha/beta hydrolase [Fontimonas sp. SYSU GA230001]|uniref:alpha/beta hydrolase n=1 Tax=Fontimonas sp. SYSU GA230001 TaxID=3142450 RepID=UPI0032B3B990